MSKKRMKKMPPYGKVRLRAAKVVTQTNVQKKKNKI